MGMNWRTFTDNYVRGYEIGERNRDRNEKRDEAIAYGEYLDSGEGTGIKQTVGYETGVDQLQQPQEGIPLDVSKGISAENGGSRPSGFNNALESGMPAIPEAKVKAAYVVDPEFHESRHAARAKYLKAVAQRDPQRAVMMEDYLEKQTREEASNALIDAAHFFEIGDRKRGSEAALHAYGLIPDGGRAQVKAGPNGELFAISFDQESGEMTGGASLDPESLREFALMVRDPVLGMQWKRQTRMDESTLASQEEVRASSKQSREQSAELFPLQKKNEEMKQQIAQFSIDHLDEQWELTKATAESRIGAYDAQAVATLLRGLGATSGTAGVLGITKPKDIIAMQKNVREVSSGLIESRVGDGTLEGAYAEKMGAKGTNRVNSLTWETMVSHANATGEVLSADTAAEGALRLATFEDALVNGKGAEGGAALDRMAKEYALDYEWNEKSGTLKLNINGQPVYMNPNLHPEFIQFATAHAEEMKRSGTPEEQKEAASFLEGVSNWVKRSASGTNEYGPGMGGAIEEGAGSAVRAGAYAVDRLGEAFDNAGRAIADDRYDSEEDEFLFGTAQ